MEEKAGKGREVTASQDRVKLAHNPQEISQWFFQCLSLSSTLCCHTGTVVPVVMITPQSQDRCDDYDYDNAGKAPWAPQYAVSVH